MSTTSEGVNAFLEAAIDFIVTFAEIPAKFIILMALGVMWLLLFAFLIVSFLGGLIIVARITCNIGSWILGTVKGRSYAQLKRGEDPEVQVGCTPCKEYSHE